MADQTYRIEHGSNILKGNRPKSIEIYSWFLNRIDKTILGRPVYQFLHFFEYLGYKLIGAPLMTGSKVARHLNEVMKQAGREENFLICGETHCAEIDENARYANSGCILYGTASYLLLDENGVALRRENF